MAEREVVVDALDAAPGGLTGRAVALARLLLQECTHLLELYREREDFSPDHAPDGGRIVSPSPSGGQQQPAAGGSGEQVRLLHLALRQCLGLLRCLILKEEEEMGELEGEYETARRNVRLRLEHLLHSTRVLLETEEDALDAGPDHQCSEEVDGAFAAKMWTYRVLLELIHWADHASQTLHTLHTESSDTRDV